MYDRLTCHGRSILWVFSSETKEFIMVCQIRLPRGKTSHKLNYFDTLLNIQKNMNLRVEN